MGGRIRSFTAGANWYRNPNSRFVVNYIMTRIEDRDHPVQLPNTYAAGRNSELQALVLRFQFSF